MQILVKESKKNANFAPLHQGAGSDGADGAVGTRPAWRRDRGPGHRETGIRPGNRAVPMTPDGPAFKAPRFKVAAPARPGHSQFHG